MESGPHNTYRIGAVSRLTGIPTVTLRAWERRYGAVQTLREASGCRLYRAEDVERLVLIKRLVDLGNAISTVACLPLAELQERVRVDCEQFRRSHRPAVPLRRVVVVGAALAVRLRAGVSQLSDLRIVAAFNTIEDFEAAADGLERPDVLMIEFPTAHLDTITVIKRLTLRCGARCPVLIYGFARQAVLEALEAAGIVAMSAPVNFTELRLACLAEPSLLVQLPADAPPEEPRVPAELSPVPPRRFTAEQIGQLAGMSPGLECECTRQLSGLVNSLCAFEEYSAECENRSPQDAEVHAYLHRVSAGARAELEEALDRLMRVHGLSINKSS